MWCFKGTSNACMFRPPFLPRKSRDATTLKRQLMEKYWILCANYCSEQRMMEKKCIVLESSNYLSLCIFNKTCISEDHAC